MSKPLRKPITINASSRETAILVFNLRLKHGFAKNVQCYLTNVGFAMFSPTGKSVLIPPLTQKLQNLCRF